MASNPRKRTRGDSSPNALPASGDICKHCNKKCTTKGKNSEAIQCDVCFTWVHSSCEGLSKEQYKVFSDIAKAIPNLTYCCKLNNCSVRLNQLVAADSASKSVVVDEVLDDIEKNYSLVTDTISSLSTKIETLLSNNAKLETRVNELSKFIESAPPQMSFSTQEPVSSHVPTTVAVDVVNELHNRDRRKCNVVVHNLPESVDQQESHNDTNSFLEICRSVFNLDVEIIKCYRLGKKQSSRPRSLLIQLSNEMSRNQVLSNAPKLRFSSTMKQVYIQQDMTPTERETYKKLYEELKRRRSQGENNLIIRNGRIVPYADKFQSRILFNNPSNTVPSTSSLSTSVPDNTGMDTNTGHVNTSHS